MYLQSRTLWVHCVYVSLRVTPLRVQHLRLCVHFFFFCSISVLGKNVNYLFEYSVHVILLFVKNNTVLSRTFIQPTNNSDARQNCDKRHKYRSHIRAFNCQKCHFTGDDDYYYYNIFKIIIISSEIWLACFNSRRCRR